MVAPLRPCFPACAGLNLTEERPCGVASFLPRFRGAILSYEFPQFSVP